MKLHIVFLFVIALFISSCESNKVLLRGDFVYKFAPHDTVINGISTPNPSFHKFQIIKRRKVDLTDNGTYLILRDSPEAHKDFYLDLGWHPLSINLQLPWKDTSVLYFNEDGDKYGSKRLWYNDQKVVLQAATIPIKIRPAINTAALKDSIPSNVETGFNVGFLVGYKYGWNKFRTSTNILGQQTGKYTITGGGIFSIGAADLSPAKTRPAITFERNAPMISLGASVVFGINDISLGYALGWDWATGSGSSTWLYQGKHWHGIILTLDLIK